MDGFFTGIKTIATLVFTYYKDNIRVSFVLTSFSF